MKTYFKLELKKALFSWKTKISIIIILGFYIIPYINELSMGLSHFDGLNYYLYICDLSYVIFVYPLISGIIYSTSIIKDKETGFLNRLLEVIDIKTYFKTKLVVNAVITSLVFSVSNCIMILYLICFYGISNTAVENRARRVFSGVYERSPILYIILELVVLIISSVSFSTFMLGVITTARKKFIAYLLPGFLVVLTGILFGMWSLNNVVDFNIVRLFAPLSFIPNIVNTIIYDLILILVGSFLLYKFGYKKTLVLCEKKV